MFFRLVFYMHMPIYFSSGSDSFLNKWTSNWGLFSSSWRTSVILTVQPFWPEFILAFIFGKCLYFTFTFERHLTGFKILHLLSFDELFRCHSLAVSSTSSGGKPSFFCCSPIQTSFYCSSERSFLIFLPAFKTPPRRSASITPTGMCSDVPSSPL